MKKLKIIALAIIALAVAYSCKNVQKSDKVTSDIVGAYEYTGDLEGFALYDESHFAFTFRTRPDKPDSLLTVEEKYNSLESTAGTWTAQDSVVTLTVTFHKDPQMIGSVHRFVYKNSGNEHNFRLIDQDGNTVGTGSAKKIN